MTQKPFKGVIENWSRRYVGDEHLGLGYSIVGHEVTYLNNRVCTSPVQSHDTRTGIIETRNSIYYLKSKENI